MVAYKRSKNLRDLLVRAKLQTKRTSHRIKNGFSECGRVCKLCMFANRMTEHKCHRTRKSWKINSKVNCLTKNVIYKIACKKCPNFVYIGETSRRFCDRFAEHKGYVTQKKINQPVGEHFNSKGHNVSDMLPVIIEQVTPLQDHFLRRRREKVWINTYQAIDYGANSRF